MYLQNMHSEPITRFIKYRKTLISHIIFYGNKKSHSVPSQDYTTNDSSNRCFECSKCSCLSRCVRARIVVVKSGQFSAVGFPDFLEVNWQTNGCVPLRIDC